MTDKMQIILPRLEKVIAKNGTFSLMLLTTPVGTTTHAKPSIPTYFTSLSHNGNPRPRRITTNLHYVGPTALVNLAGVTIAFAATGAPLTAVQNLARRVDDGVDVLITSIAPTSPGLYGVHARHIGQSMHARYHFSGATTFRQYAPFRTYGVTHGTHMITLASPGSSQRGVYAADIKPLARMTEAQRAATACQTSTNLYETNAAGHKRVQESVQEGVECATSPHSVRKWARTDNACWFCLGDQMPAHLLILHATHVFVALAKGGLDPSHMVIVPIAHIGASTSMGFCDETIKEVERIMQAIRVLYREKFGDAQPYFFERCGETSGGKVRHMHIQVVAVQNKHVSHVQNRCVDLARQYGVEARMKAQDDDDCAKALTEAKSLKLKEFFWAQLGGTANVVVPFSTHKLLPVHFGRMVVATAMQLPDLVDWRTCVKEESEETNFARNLKSILMPIFEKVA